MGRLNTPGPAAERAEEEGSRPGAAKRLSLRVLALWVLAGVLLTLAAVGWVLGPMVCMVMRGCGG